jgi:hypothetical protein
MGSYEPNSVVSGGCKTKGVVSGMWFVVNNKGVVRGEWFVVNNKGVVRGEWFVLSARK